MSEQVVLGYTAAIVAVFFFGTCYVPAKAYATYDGIIFQWFMCSGILMVGLAWGLLSNNWSQFSQSGMFTFPEGLLGGALFAIANLLIPTVVNTLGLGVGFMLWNATNITLGYCVSRLGLFGVAPTIPSMPWTSLLGIGFMLASIAVYGTIKPTLKAPKTSKRVRRAKAKRDGDDENAEPKVHWETVGSSTSLNSSLGESSPLLPQFADDADLASAPLVRRESLQASLVHPELPNFGPYMMPNELGEHVELMDAGAEKTRKAFGMAIALLVGAFLSCCLVPFVNWKNRCRPSDPALSSPIVETCNPLNFVFSQCLGVYLTSTIVFLLYSLFHRFVLKRSMPRSVMRPAYICGVLWGIGLCGQLYAIGALGFDQIFPICSIGPAMVSMLWSAGYFKEIQGKKNLNTLVLGTLLVLIGTGLRVISIPFSLHTRLANVLAEDHQDAFDPNGKAIKVWEHVLLLSLLLEAFLLPYFLAFQPQAVEAVSTLFVLVLVCEGVFAADLYVQARTGYYSDGNLIRDKKLTTRRYVHSFQFVLDLVAILPYQVLVMGYPSFVAKLLLLKLVRWSRLPHFVSSLDEFYAKYFVVLKLLKVLASTVYLAHVQACVRYRLVHKYSSSGPESEGPSHTQPLHGQYLASMFWSVGIMTGLFEGELPRHSSEFFFTIIVALCGFSMFTTLCATIFVISKCESGQTEALEARINQLVHVLSFHRVPESQQTQAIEYLQRYYTDTESHDRETAKILCPSIANDIQVELLKSTIARVSIFEGCNDQFIVAMTSLLEMMAVPVQTTLFSTGDQGDAMYVVHSGVLAIVIKSVLVREIRKGSCFGELSVFSSMPRTATVISTTHSPVRMWWLLLLLSNLYYCWIMIPVQVTFPLWQRPGWAIQAIDTISNAGLLFNLVLNFSLSFTFDSENILDPKQSARRYIRGSFVFDLLCALPYEYLFMARYGLMRLPRLLGVFHLRSYLKEIAYFIPFSSRRQLILLGILLFMMFHIVTCIHFSISYSEGFNPNEEEAWISPISVCLSRVNATHLQNCNGAMFDTAANQSELQAITMLEYSRSLYYAVGVLASPGKSVEPTTDVQLSAALILMLSGFLITAIVVDNVQKRFTASAFEQKEFFLTSTRIQLFLRRQNAPLAIHQRVKSFLDYWWSSHRGAVIGELLADLPRPVRLDLLRSICLPVLQTLALLQNARPVLAKLEELMVENAKFILYGQGEIVYRHGDSVVGMFFLLEGDVCMVEKGESSREVPRGAFFGTAALTQQERGEGYTEHVSANSGCILLLISRDQLQAMEAIFPTLKEEFFSLQQRLLGNKLSSMRAKKSWLSQEKMTSRVLHKLFSDLKGTCTAVHDPNSLFILAWETWVFLVMTMQWALVVFQACFPMNGAHKNADTLMVFLELSFVLDVQIRSRLGFYEFGNKIMDPVRIKRKYFRSCTFALDIAALLPLYVVNWVVPSSKRWDLLNVNKLLRLFKVPSQLHALETRYLKHTTELRLFKLLYYMFMLSHLLGCVWFNFASREAVPSFLSAADKATAFGDNHWLPSEHLEHGSHVLQYMASLYWSFGLMSASSEPEFPKTTAQCIFSVLTMTAGFFLFAYVIGNFADIIELNSSETREFNAKMRAVRKMLDHFQMPEELQTRIKTFLLFKRYHTITQEHLLVHCLPPSLLTDIRLVHLKPMIDKVEFLRGMEGSITRMLVSQFTQALISRGEYVCKFGESGSDMFFIFTGVLDVLVPSRVANRHCSTFKSLVRNLNLVGKPGGLSGVPGRVAPAGNGQEQASKAQDQLVKVNEISAGRYFGENGLFTTGKRNALSRESMELVFARYPKWKQKVLRIASIRREQERLVQLSRDEQRRGMATLTDIMNERAERLKEELNHARLKRSNSSRLDLLNTAVVKSLSMDAMNRVTAFATVANTVYLLCEVAFTLDVWFSWHIQESPASLELYEQNLRSVYKKKRMLLDVTAAIPFHGLLFIFESRPWLKLLRCIKILNVVGYLDEISRRSVANEATRFWQVWMLYLLVIHWAACAYLAVAVDAGFGTEWESWLPSGELEIPDPQDPSPGQLARRFLRGLFFATTAFVKKARNIAPETASLYAFQITMSFVGLITMSFVIGELASLFISYIGLEVDFRKNHIAVELYLARLRVSDRLKSRTYAFMTSLWSSHAGVNYDSLLEEMPRPIRAACILHASKEPLDWFIMKVITPVCRSEVEAFTLSVAEQLRFEGYPRDENVVTEGSIVRAMYFVTKGYLNMQSNSLLDRPVGLRAGSYFGERGLLAFTISAYTVRTVRACDLFSLSSQAFVQVLEKHSFSRLALTLCNRAHMHLKAKKLADCSRLDMEGHWGSALLYTVKEFQTQHEANVTASGEESAEEETTTNTADAVDFEFTTGGGSKRQNASECDGKEATSSEGDDLPATLSEMLKSLNSSESCFETLAPLLHIMLATDPLDWSVNFSEASNG
uniref:Cyclic nucleotide-binding domain-containing protein n=1 Tax=Phytophthora ramorum TaxID=164328 RepID=H3H1W6_PHYRM